MTAWERSRTVGDMSVCHIICVVQVDGLCEFPQLWPGVVQPACIMPSVHQVRNRLAQEATGKETPYRKSSTMFSGLDSITACSGRLGCSRPLPCQ